MNEAEQIKILQTFADRMKLENIKLRTGLLEARAGLEFAIKALRGGPIDGMRSTPKVALECVNEALEN